MRAMILCAGLGTRLRPLTGRWPKPALPLLGAPLLRSHLEGLQRAGVREVGINTHHLGDVMREIAGAECARLGLTLTVVHEPVLQGTGGGIRGLREFLQASDPFVILNGDVVFELPLSEVVASHVARGADATMVLQTLPVGERYAAVETDGAGWVRRIAGIGPGGEGLSPWHFTGVHVMRPRIFDFMRPDGPEDINRDVYARLMAAGGAIWGEQVQGPWFDLGTPSRYLGMVREVLTGRCPPPSGAPLEAYVRTGSVWVHRDAKVSADARIGDETLIEAGATVGAGASVSRSVVLPGTSISGGERLVDVIAADGDRIHAGG